VAEAVGASKEAGERFSLKEADLEEDCSPPLWPAASSPYMYGSIEAQVLGVKTCPVELKMTERTFVYYKCPKVLHIQRSMSAREGPISGARKR
jgi:hypothetical protein